MATAIGDLVVRLGATSAQFDRTMQRAQGVLGGFRGAINGAIRDMAMMAAGAFGLSKAMQSISFGLKLAADMEQAQVAFSVMIGSAERAKEMLADLKKFADTTPFEFPEIRDAAKLLIGFGFGADQVTGLLRRLGDVSAGLSVPIGEIAAVYGKARVQGRAFARDIHELTNRGVPIIQELAKQFGVADNAVMKLVEEGVVGFPQIEKAFVSLTSAGGRFAGLTEAQSKTLAGLWSTFRDSVNNSLRSVGETIIRVFNLKQVVANVTELMTSVTGMFTRMAEWLPMLARIAVALAGMKLGIIAVNVALRLYELWQRRAAIAAVFMQAIVGGPAAWAKLAAGIALATVGVIALNKAIGEIPPVSEAAAASVDKVTQAVKSIPSGPLIDLSPGVGEVDYVARVKDYMQELKDTLSGIESALERPLTLQQKYMQQQANINRLHEVGLIDLEKRNRLLAESDRVHIDEPRMKAMEERRKALAERGSAIFEATRTPFEKFQQSVRELRGLASVGAIDPTTFQRAMAKARADFEATIPKGEKKDEKRQGTQFAGAMERGTTEAWSTVLAAMGRDREKVTKGEKGIRDELKGLRTDVRERREDVIEIA